MITITVLFILTQKGQ